MIKKKTDKINLELKIFQIDKLQFQFQRQCGSRVFSKERDGFSKVFKILLTFCFRPTKLIFPALREHQEDPVLAKFYAPQAKFRKQNRVK